MCGGSVSWRSKKQTVIATPSCEAEYIASCFASKECVWLSQLVADVLGLAAPIPTLLKMDNNGAMDSSRSNSVNQRNKHVDVNYHYVRDCVSKKKVVLEYCSTENQVADSLTKALENTKHSKHTTLQGLGLCNF